MHTHTRTHAYACTYTHTRKNKEEKAKKQHKQRETSDLKPQNTTKQQKELEKKQKGVKTQQQGSRKQETEQPTGSGETQATSNQATKILLLTNHKMQKQQRGEFTATLTTKTYPSSPEEHWLGEVKRGDGPTIYMSSRPKKSKTEEEMRNEIKTGREKSYKEDSDIEKRENNARTAEAQLHYFQERYGENSGKRPKIID